MLSDGRAGTSEQQFAPLQRYRQAIAGKLGILFDFGSVDEIDAISADQVSAYDAVGLKMSFETPAPVAVAKAQKFFETARSVEARCLVFDGDDDQCVLWPDVITACDAYIKKHRFSDLNAYTKPFIGKSNLTDYAARNYGVDFSADIIPKTRALTEDQIGKIVLGWNIALDDKIHFLARDISPDRLRLTRNVDISCRASVGPDQWTYGIRNDAVKAIMALQGSFKVHAPTDRVPQQEYYNEMLNSRLTVSPFGFGELCWRDFEAILCGSVLVKPDMSHIMTYPDLFVPGETYIPIAWDYSDLGEKCTSILEDTAALERMAETARMRLLDTLSPKNFLKRLDQTMRASGLIDDVGPFADRAS
ncbi:hypothetical protein RA27_18190 [Ruegeria sp. ANG-R]|nr:hypothetical protein RA27_18190 [Ruegeria sp. ANG-R]